MPSIYLINPRPVLAGYSQGVAFAHYGYRPATLIGDLALPTVAGLMPADFEVELCDETVQEVDLDSQADFIGITGKAVQWGRARELADEFRRRGKVVLIGGPFASLSHERVRPHCDILVRGELEEIASQLFDDLRRGEWAAEYVGSPSDMSRPILPRWDLHSEYRCSMASVQTSRGCPFECEFCDAIIYLGRRQRHKPIENVLAELDSLYELGYRQVFLADDNLTVYRRRAHGLLSALGDWNASQVQGRMVFASQASIDITRDEELLELCNRAEIQTLFIGLETPNAESLIETRKRQNLVDLVAEVERVVSHGISVSGGMIVGFDNDGPDIFARQLEFAQQLPVPHFSTGSLFAPDGTPLRERIRAEGRLIEDDDYEAAARPWGTNIVPARMSPDELEDGLRWLVNRLYAPENYGVRLLRLIELLPPTSRPESSHSGGYRALRDVDDDALQMIASLPQLGPSEGKMFRAVMAAARKRPWTLPVVGSQLLLYLDDRALHEQNGLWDPSATGDGMEVVRS